MQLTLETGEIGRQANGAVMARLGHTVCAAAMRHSRPYAVLAVSSTLIAVTSHPTDMLPAVQILYTTACCDRQPTGDGSFLPLQV